MWAKAFELLQKIGKALMLPVAVLPVAGLLLGVGAAGFSWMPAVVSDLMRLSGEAVFGNMALIFAVAVALGLTDNDGVSAVAATIGYVVMLATMGVMAKVLELEPVRIMGDRMRLEQVLVNLLRNALDATKSVADPEIELILASGETATLTVRDNGHGIEDLENLFEPFYTTKAAGEGVGLGLAISSGIVSDLGGRLTARNAEEGGAVFEIQLPILNEEQKEAAE